MEGKLRQNLKQNKNIKLEKGGLILISNYNTHYLFRRYKKRVKITCLYKQMSMSSKGYKELGDISEEQYIAALKSEYPDFRLADMIKEIEEK